MPTTDSAAAVCSRGARAGRPARGVPQVNATEPRRLQRALGPPAVGAAEARASGDPDGSSAEAASRPTPEVVDRMQPGVDGLGGVEDAVPKLLERLHHAVVQTSSRGLARVQASASAHCRRAARSKSESAASRPRRRSPASFSATGMRAADPLCASGGRSGSPRPEAVLLALQIGGVDGNHMTRFSTFPTTMT